MHIKTLGKFVIVDIHKPMSVQPDYDFCRVRKDYFDKKRPVLVRTPNGEKIFNPDQMKHQKTVKEVFLFPDRPMEMYELCIPHGDKKPEDYYIFFTSIFSLFFYPFLFSFSGKASWYIE